MTEASKGRTASPETLAKMRESALASLLDPAIVARRKAARVRMGQGYSGIPKWVPKDLEADFIDTARQFGEEAAASLVRRLKREAARP